MNIGDKAPDLLGTDQNGNEIHLSQYAGRKLVLYFYPKDNTSGCTAEACSLRDNYEQLKEAGYEVVGVSADSASSHQKLSELMGTWGEKSMYGRKYMGMFRTTFILSPDGTIEKIFLPKEIKTKNHAEQILKTK